MVDHRYRVSAHFRGAGLVPGGVGAPLPCSPLVCPVSGAKAATYTSALTFGSLPASVITVPPQECPTRTTLPCWLFKARRVAATSSASEVSGFCTTVTATPLGLEQWHHFGPIGAVGERAVYDHHGGRCILRVTGACGEGTGQGKSDGSDFRFDCFHWMSSCSGVQIPLTGLRCGHRSISRPRDIFHG